MTDDATPPESGWFFRRLFTYAVTAINSVFIAAIIWKLDDPQALKWLGLGLILSNIVMATLYLAGATVTEWAQVAAGARGNLRIGPAKTERKEAEGDGA